MPKKRADKAKENFNFIRVDAALVLSVPLYASSAVGLLFAPASSSCLLEHFTKTLSACIILHNMAIDDKMPESKPLTSEIRIGDCKRPLRQDTLTVAPRALKKHLNISH